MIHNVIMIIAIIVLYLDYLARHVAGGVRETLKGVSCFADIAL